MPYQYFLSPRCWLLSVGIGYRLGRFEDRTLSRIPFLRDHDGSIAMMSAKAHRKSVPQGDCELVTHFEEPADVQT